MTSKPDNVIDLFPYQEDALLDRAFEVMREVTQRKRALEHKSKYGGVVFVDKDGKEVGHLVPLDKPTDPEEEL